MKWCLTSIADAALDTRGGQLPFSAVATRLTRNKKAVILILNDSLFDAAAAAILTKRSAFFNSIE